MIRDGAVRDWRQSSRSTDSRIEQSEGSTDLALPRQPYGRHFLRSGKTREEHVEPQSFGLNLELFARSQYSHSHIPRIGVFARSRPLDLRC